MDYIVTFDDGSEALMHYGVLGMKWGVRRDRSGAFSKSTAKLAKLDAKATKYKEKREAHMDKVTNRFNRKERAGKMLAKADKYDMRSAKYAEKASKYGSKTSGLLRSEESKMRNMKKYVKYDNKSKAWARDAKKLREKATGNDDKAKRLAYKQEKYQYKANKWAKRMNKEFGSAKMSNVTSEQKKLGKKYMLDMVG